MAHIKSSMIQPIGHRRDDFVSVSDRGLVFSKSACRLCDMAAGKFIHFINDESFWFFYIGEEVDGFKILNNSFSKGNLLIAHSALAGMFMKSTGARPGNRYLIHATTGLTNGRKLFEIQANKSIKELTEERNEVIKFRRQVLSNAYNKIPSLV